MEGVNKQGGLVLEFLLILICLLLASINYKFNKLIKNLVPSDKAGAIIISGHVLAQVQKENDQMKEYEEKELKEFLKNNRNRLM